MTTQCRKHADLRDDGRSAVLMDVFEPAGGLAEGHALLLEGFL
jgi:hypothetical protein